MLDELISTNAYVKGTICRTGSILKHENEKYAQIKKKSNFHFSFNYHPTLNYLILIFTIFSIILTIGTQPISEKNLAFAQSDLSSPSSDPKSPTDSKDPFDFSGKNIHKASDIIIPDIVGPDGESDIGSSSTTSPPSQSQSRSSAQPAYSSYHDNTVDIGNPDNDEIIETDDIPGTELSTTNSQMDTHNININNNTNEDTIEEVIEVEDLSSSTQSESTASPQPQPQPQSESGAQPKYYKSYRDYMEKNNQSANSDINGTGNTQGSESSRDSQIDTDNSNININKNTNDINIIVPDDKLSSNDELNSGDNSVTELSSIPTASSELSAQASNEVYGDFNDDGFDDLAIGVPDEDIDTVTGTVEDAGAVNILYGSSNGLSATSPRPDQFWTQDSPDVNDKVEQFDNFGFSLASADFNDDGFDDLAIGAPNEGVTTESGIITQAGSVNILYGSSNGLSATSPRPDQFWTQDSTDVNGVAEPNHLFGFSLSSADFNGDGFNDLAIGAPGEDLDTVAGTMIAAGAVNILYGSSNGLSATSPRPDQFWTQDSPDVNDKVEQFDNFGFSLASADFNGDGFDDLAIGAPNEGVTKGVSFIHGVGAINILYGSSNGLSATSPRPDQFWTQDTTNVNDQAEEFDRFGISLSSGDFNGDNRDDLAIGVPSEDVDTGAGTIENAGAVNVLYSSSNGLSATSPRPDQFWTQDSADVNDSPEGDDLFATSLSVGDFNGDGIDDLAIGVPNEAGVGAVNVLYSSSNGLSAASPRPDQIWTQSTTDVNDVAEASDGFGSLLASADFNGDSRDDLAIGVPDEDVDTGTGTIENAGAVSVLYSSSNGLSATSPRPDQFWTQSTSDVNDVSELEDNFGSALS
jgi:hypothetical protein